MPALPLTKLNNNSNTHLTSLCPAFGRGCKRSVYRVLNSLKDIHNWYNYRRKHIWALVFHETTLTGPETGMNDVGWLHLPLTINVLDKLSASSAANTPSP
jgi:hypothetical protein